MFDDKTSTATGLSTGAKVALITAIPFLVLGLYFLITPITELRTQTGAVFGCGTAIAGAGDEFKSNICGSINTVYMYKGLLSIAVGVLIAAAGFLLFGSAKSSAHSAPTYVKPTAPTANSAPTASPKPSAAAGSRGRPRTFD